MEYKFGLTLRSDECKVIDVLGQVDQCSSAGFPAKEARHDGQRCTLEHHVDLLIVERLLINYCFLLVSAYPNLNLNI